MPASVGLCFWRSIWFRPICAGHLARPWSGCVLRSEDCLWNRSGIARKCGYGWARVALWLWCVPALRRAPRWGSRLLPSRKQAAPRARRRTRRNTRRPPRRTPELARQRARPSRPSPIPHRILQQDVFQQTSTQKRVRPPRLTTANRSTRARTRTAEGRLRGASRRLNRSARRPFRKR